jgi:hypothetical protein
MLLSFPGVILCESETLPGLTAGSSPFPTLRDNRYKHGKKARLFINLLATRD